MNTIAQDLFTRALELPASERDAFLAEACGDDAELRLEIQRMLVDAARADSFFNDGDGATLGAEEFKETYSEKAGDVIGPYKLREQIGEGGFGSVWVADQEKPVRRRVALKLGQSRDGHQTGHRPLRAGASGARHDGSPEHRQGL